MHKEIKARVGEEELLAQLAEEAIELAHAALKLRRVIGCKNPTPVKYDEALENFLEEVADVDLVLAVLDIGEDTEELLARMRAKLIRWLARLRATTQDPWEEKTESGLLEEA